ncbi:autophagy related protein 14 [Rhynchophorus ferrugineus]|uniref:Beclin 1-associated autophagy-related key regulator n=1 Tax=Rhynchophorus ferrugineus TaxID=354439 RepID=A0A834HMS9_RHYFE|nr:hypothetical protein GWI33_021368 [Rhynchophorus ferrugineus]
MATIISSEDSTTSSVPRIFQISSSSDGSNLHKCPLCMSLQKFFCCTECIQTGHITSSKHDKNYNSLKKTLAELQESRRNIESKCLKQLEEKQKCHVLQSKIRQSRERSRVIQLALKEKGQRRPDLKSTLEALNTRNRERNEIIRTFKTKSESLEDYVSDKWETVHTFRDNLHAKQKEVKKLAKLRVQQLFKYVFPISLVKPTVEMESSGDSILKELAEASQTAFIRDKWVYTDYSNEIQYNIVAPCLPSSGNYSNYNIWGQSHDGIPVSEESDAVDINPAFSISAALTYTAQLVNVLSFFLNVRLPYKMIYSEFSNNTINEQQFARRVARLNVNILYLCITQNVDLKSLRVNAPIHNILQLKENESADLGRQDMLELTDAQMASLEKAIAAEFKSSDDSDSDEGDSFTMEWEAVPHVQCPEVLPGRAIVQSEVMNTQQTSSMAGGLMNSVASIWRGFTGR